MTKTLTNQKQGWLLILSGIVVGLLFQFLGIIANNSSASFTLIIKVLGSGFNAIAMGILIYLIIKEEFWDWFNHFNITWVISGIPLLLLVSTLSGTIWTSLAGNLAANSINDSLSWGYVIANVPFMLLGEELLSLGILYGAWKKINWKFWQASLFRGFLFAI